MLCVCVCVRLCVCVCHCTRLPASTHTHTRLDAFCKNSSNCCLLCVESLPDSSSHPTPAPTPMLPGRQSGRVLCLHHECHSSFHCFTSNFLPLCLPLGAFPLFFFHHLRGQSLALSRFHVHRNTEGGQLFLPAQG